MVVCTYNPSMWKPKEEDQELEVILGYMMV